MLLGTFDSVLYKDIHMSINLGNHTPHLFSWFPLFIPLRVPVLVHTDQLITYDIWRYITIYKEYILIYIYIYGIGVWIITRVGMNGGYPAP